MTLSSEFWNAYKSHVLIGDDGALRFTRTGRTRYAPLLAKYGFALDQVRILERFLELMTYVNDKAFDANTRALQKAWSHPLTSEAERDLIRRALAMDLPD